MIYTYVWSLIKYFFFSFTLFHGIAKALIVCDYLATFRNPQSNISL